MEKIVVDAHPLGEPCPVCGKEVVAVSVVSRPVGDAISQQTTYSCGRTRRNHIPRGWQPAAVSR